jgi:spore maturation protein CgeB
MDKPNEDQLLTKKAHELFTSKQYEEALAVYEILSKKLGARFFELNIKLCKDKTTASTLETRPIEHSDQGRRLSIELVNTSKPISFSGSRNEAIWFSLEACPEETLAINTKVEYLKTKGNMSRCAALLLRSECADGTILDAPLGHLSKSKQFQSFFKYLPDTQGESKQIHSCKITSNISRINIGLAAINLPEDGAVIVREMTVSRLPKSSKPIISAKAKMAMDRAATLGWPSAPKSKKPVAIAITDEFTTDCLANEISLIQPRPDNWRALADKHRPDFFFVESAWKGNYGSWQYRIASYSNTPGKELAQIHKYAKEKHIPLVFWNKEDPVHHDKFMTSAKEADYIFTTDSEMIESYRLNTKAKGVYTLPFAAQPSLHYPSPIAKRNDRSCFAGSWYSNRHKERGHDMDWLLTVAKDYKLDIYDRNYTEKGSSFPRHLSDCVIGGLPYAKLCSSYRKYRTFINVNSVKSSPTMFSRRVFELLACGTPIISSYSKGLDQFFDSGAIWLVNNKAEADVAFRTLLSDDQEWRKRSLAGIREVFANHTYEHRIQHLLEMIGIKKDTTLSPDITLAFGYENDIQLDFVKEFLRTQTLKEFRIVVFGKNPDRIRKLSQEDSRISYVPREELSDLFAKRSSSQHLAGWISSCVTYGEYYLRDLVNASIYRPDANGWGKSQLHDRFELGGASYCSTTLWKSNIFLERVLHSDPDIYISDDNLFVADSDQWHFRDS